MRLFEGSITTASPRLKGVEVFGGGGGGAHKDGRIIGYFSHSKSCISLLSIATKQSIIFKPHRISSQLWT